MKKKFILTDTTLHLPPREVLLEEVGCKEEVKQDDFLNKSISLLEILVPTAQFLVRKKVVTIGQAISLCLLSEIPKSHKEDLQNGLYMSILTENLSKGKDKDARKD